MLRRLSTPLATILAASISVLAMAQASAPTPPAAPAGRPGGAPAGATGGAPRQAAQFPTGPIVAEPAKKDLGVVKPEETVTAVFTLVNPLDRDVTIVKSATSCQCTGVDVEGKVIPAKGKLDMPASMKMSKAPIKKSASVTLVIDLGEGKKQPLRVELYAEVAYAVRAVPGFIDALTPERMKGTFELVATDNKPFKVLLADNKPPVFVDYDPATGPQTRYKLQYDFTTGGPIPKYFVVETDRNDCPVIDLRVRHDTTHIKPPFKVAEYRSTFGRIPLGQVGSFDLEIEEVGKNVVTSVKSLSPDFEVTIGKQKNDNKNTMATFNVKPAPGVKGFRMFEVEMVVDGKPYNHVVFGTVR
ncbi:MAG: DUF1573 domain-containing protein [Phycisphaerae bacterium]|nr:DUF1573 domain-containing protein [Phycisphaerae bacterium]